MTAVTPALSTAASADEARPNPVDETAAPILWTGVIEDPSDSGTVFVHALPPVSALAKEGESVGIVVVGSGTVDKSGLVAVRAAPGEWSKVAAGDDGRIRLFITAAADGGRRFGLSQVDVIWQADKALASGGFWTVDPGISAQETLTKAIDGVAVPSSDIVMQDASAEMVKALEPGSALAAAAVGPPAGYICEGGQKIYRSTTRAWVTLGKYWLAGGAPRENATYNRSTTTTTSWGFQVAGQTGPLTIGGSVTASSTRDFVAIGTSQVQGDTTNRLMNLQALYDYRHYSLTKCWWSSSPRPPSQGFEIQTVEPYRWTGDLVFNGGASNLVNPDVVRTLAPGQGIGRASGRTSSITNAFSLSLGIGAFTGNASVSTTNASGNQVTRIWTNPSTGGPKYISGNGGDPQHTGVAGVYGYQ